MALQVDVLRHEENSRMVSAALDMFGSVGVAYANAGFAQPATNIEDLTDGDIDRLWGINLKGVISLAKAVATLFKNQRSGVFVATASTAGVRPRAGIQVYSASKGAVISFIRALALEWAPFGVRVCAVSQTRRCCRGFNRQQEAQVLIQTQFSNHFAKRCRWGCLLNLRILRTRYVFWCRIKRAS